MTEKQFRLLNFIRSTFSITGKGPTFGEMKKYMGLKYNQSVQELLKILKRNGYVRIEKGVIRGIVPILDKKTVLFDKGVVKKEYNADITPVLHFSSGIVSNGYSFNYQINNLKGGDKSGTS